MKIDITNRAGGVIYTHTCENNTIRKTLEAAVAAGADLSGANLSGAYLSGANLPKAYLSGANLPKANLSGANLRCADLVGANLSGANLSGAYLSGANLPKAYLSGANLRCADLVGANLYGANLPKAYLSGANLRCADLVGANLTKTENLIDAALDWAVAKCEGVEFTHEDSPAPELFHYLYSTDWSQGGPIIERAEIDLTHQIGGGCVAAILFNELIYEESGPTPLIAAMRCYVAARLGSEIDVPDELLEK